ncbi:ATP-dependent 6- platelet type-like isoform X1, partial [Clarias magur]
MKLQGSASHLHPLHSTENESDLDYRTASKMIWMRVLIVSSLLALLHAHKHCTQLIKWGNLLQALSSMSNGISETCAHHYNKDRLCDPSYMLHQVELNAKLLSDVMKKAESLYSKNPNPEDFIEMLQHTQHTLTSCAHHPHNVDHKPVARCFHQLEAFIQDNM